MGIVDMYPESFENFNCWQTMHQGSGGLEFSSPFLDSVGCFVFAERIENYPSKTMTTTQAISLVAAHEIGHALGMWHYPEYYNGYHEPHVMIENIANAFNVTNGFEMYNQFLHKTLDGSYDIDNYQRDGMNMRHVLGINCVNSIHE
jgi:hypothetical protein